MLSSQTTVLLIIVAEVLSFVVLLGLLVILYRILITRYKEKKGSTPRDIEASPAPITATTTPSPALSLLDKELLYFHPALRINTNVNNNNNNSPPVLQSTITKPSATANPTNKPSYNPPEPFQSASAQLQYKYLLSRLHTRPQRTQALRSESVPRHYSSQVPRPLRPIQTTLLPPKKPMPVIQESVARGSVNVVSPCSDAVRSPASADRMS
ncbi:hypothetical protein MGYG_06820 [Nannizzia gypsea CBS 118893]|uniref:Uncharacterized protein n=1 Tax=Arthroderma gypseum (strain ATCC MYA-4604 / CBS 118893) TaxID=535722 RepID=E4V1A5_ARTGP|nr:hypothetical protein MGYG_06820 [Nannizzia gypsea CBS 118893]EFR03820.1 hypothetical protein MGYG_06820 [Nannizzia gypsea CBS 118893]